ncbi:MAG: CPBP family intramembrane metalloprotease [Bacteroidales bacterium]|nr:CPBP family intramembrane metalloprotease [Bacteroidales bacterium]
MVTFNNQYILSLIFCFASLFFHRYDNLFKNETLKIILSGLFFSLGHILYKNILVLALAFIAGVIFACHYSKTKSLTMNVFEHSIYGVWLFASGLGYFFVSRMVE